MHASRDTRQRVTALHGGVLKTLVLPGPDVRLGDGPLVWGDASTPLTPAYWRAQTWMWSIEEPDHFRLGRTLEEELLACMLGGYGIPAEVGLAAYRRLGRAMRRTPDVLRDPLAVQGMLSAPLDVDGRAVRYRFASQKAGYIASAFRDLPRLDRGAADRELRDQLTTLRGVGPKTASWVVRNLRSSDEVAILDVHILRAGSALGIFDPEHRVERHYPRMESAYLSFARGISAPASLLDSVIWMTMRQISPAPRSRAERPNPASGQLAMAC